MGQQAIDELVKGVTDLVRGLLESDALLAIRGSGVRIIGIVTWRFLKIEKSMAWCLAGLVHMAL